MRALRALSGRMVSVVAAVLVSAGLSAAQNVIVVDSNGGADFTKLSSAVNAAVDGDIILIRQSDFWLDPVTINSKSLTITADVGAMGVLNNGITIDGLASNKRIVLSGLDNWPSQFGDIPKWALRIEGAHGPVWVLNSKLKGGNAFPEAPQPGYGLVVTDSNNVVAVNCEIESGQTSSIWPPAIPGISATNSRVSLFGCVATGSNNNGPTSWTANEGCSFAGGTLYAAGSTFLGGWDFALSFDAGIAGTDATLVLLANEFGLGPPEVTTVGGEVITLSGEPRELAVSSPVREGQSVQVTATGSAGEMVWLAVDVSAMYQLQLVHAAPLLVGPNLLLVPVGSVGGGGTVSVSAPVGLLPNWAEGFTLFLQGVFIAPAQPATLSNPAVLVLLDSSF